MFIIFSSLRNLRPSILRHIKHNVVHNIYKHFFSKTWKEIKNFELRTLRLEAILYFVKKKVIDIYGSEWDDLSNLPRKYRIIGHKQYKKCIKGPIKYVAEDQHSLKIDLLKQYKFTICYENLAQEGFYSEKIIHCFLSGSIPIYYGPKDINKYVPKNAFINVRDFKSLDELHAFMDNIDNNKAKKYIIEGRNFILSLKKDQMKHSPEYIANSFFELLLE